MPKNEVSDPITDQEMAFALLVLSGAMTDRQAAEAVGLNPDSAADTKAKSHVRSYMLGHRAAVQQQFVQQEAELSRPPRLSRHAAEHAAEHAGEGLDRLNPDREQVLARLWEIAHLSPEITRNSVTGQVKALSLIVAMQNFILDRRAVSAEKKSAPAPSNAQIYQAEWLRKQQATTPATKNDPPPAHAPDPEEAQQEEAQQEEASPGPSQSTFAHPLSDLEEPPVAPYVPLFPSVTSTRVGFSVRKNPFARRPR